jgi:hypothetical protein
MAKKLPKAKVTDCASPVGYRQTKEDLERQRRYAAEDAIRTLTRAEEIRGDKRLMGDVKSLAQEQIQVAKRFTK